MINVALLSKWHVHAEDYARQVQENKQLSLACIWDEDTRRGKEWADKWEVPFEENLDTVLNDAHIDAVIINTTTKWHTEIIQKAAAHKKHIFTEKVLAFTTEDCEKIYKTVEKENVKLMVSLPRLTESYFLYAEEAFKKGWLGNLTSIRCRLAHNGSVSTETHPNGWLPSHFYDKDDCGGGALIDLGAHPIYLTNRLAGPLASVYSSLHPSPKHNVEDNAVVVTQYKSGAIGVIETGFTSYGSPFQLELYGTEGCLLIEDSNVRIRSTQLNKNEWFEPEELPKSLPTAMEQWAHLIENDVAPSITKEDIISLTLLNEAAYLSDTQGERIDIE